MAAIEQLQAAYWEPFLRRIQSLAPEFTHHKPNGRVIKFPLGNSNWLETIANFGDKNISVALVLNDETTAKDIFDHLRTEKAEIEREFSEPLQWKWGRADRRRTIRLTRDGVSDPNISDQWTEQHEWLCQTLATFDRIFAPRLESFLAAATSPQGRDTEHDKRLRQSSFTPRQPDPFLRRQVEDAAVAETTRHFTEEGYTVKSFEPDNVGWDLEAMRGRDLLRLEVKGLSGSDLCVELTPNEYSKMQQYRDSYRICVVTNALTNPTLAVFAFSKDIQDWADQNGRLLAVEEIKAARCRVVRE